MITYKWSVNSIEWKSGGNNEVVHAFWKCTADNGVHVEEAEGGAAFPEVDPNAAGFIPLDELTETDVVNWVKSQIDTDEIENFLAGRIESRIFPDTLHGKPWVNERHEVAVGSDEYRQAAIQAERDNRLDALSAATGRRNTTLQAMGLSILSKKIKSTPLTPKEEAMEARLEAMSAKVDAIDEAAEQAIANGTPLESIVWPS